MLDLSSPLIKKLIKRTADLLEKMAATSIVGAVIQDGYYLLLLGIICALFCYFFVIIGVKYAKD